MTLPPWMRPVSFKTTDLRTRLRFLGPSKTSPSTWYTHVLIGLCADCGMELVESRNFAEYEHERPSLATRMSAKFHPFRASTEPSIFGWATGARTLKSFRSAGSRSMLRLVTRICTSLSISRACSCTSARNHPNSSPSNSSVRSAVAIIHHVRTSTQRTWFASRGRGSLHVRIRRGYHQNRHRNRKLSDSPG